MRTRQTLTGCIVMLLLAACGSPAPAFPQPDQDYTHLGLSDAEAATLLSLEQVDDHPLYVMHQYAEYTYDNYEGPSASRSEIDEPWACTLFAALADSESMLFARNFDWGPSPALLLLSDPPGVYASAAMVDIAYLGFGGDGAQHLDDRPINELVTLLDAHHIPFDGMNAKGLAIAMAAVGPGNMETDSNKDTIGSLGIIRLVLDTAGTVDEAIETLGAYNIDFEGGPPLHYLVSDAGGEVALIEFYEGSMRVIRSETPWYQASNFLESAMDSTSGRCTRYDTVAAELETRQGVLDFDGAIGLLEQVAQADTRWSVVYNQSTGEIGLALGRAFEKIYTFELPLD